jgi:hypothetical protein
VNSKDGRRIKRLEASRLPRALVSEWLAEVKRFDCPSEYLKWALDNWSARARVPRLLMQALEIDQDDGGKGGKELPAHILSTTSAVKFHQTLLWELNLEADELVSRCRDRLETAVAILTLIELPSISSLGQETNEPPVSQGLTPKGDGAESIQMPPRTMRRTPSQITSRRSATSRRRC